MPDDDWGPWIAHDGGECPLSDGVFVWMRLADGEEICGFIRKGPVADNEVDVWCWADCAAKGRPEFRLLRYCIRKPRALSQLREMIETLPAPQKEHETT